MTAAPLQLRDRIRRDNVIGELIDARQRDKLSQAEYTDARRLLHATNWKLDGIIGAPVTLVEKIRAACSSFRGRAQATPTEQPPKIVTQKTIDPNDGYGLQVTTTYG